MTEATFTSLILFPAGLGLLGFVEPCSIGSTLIFIKYLERKDAARRIMETVLFAATRALFVGALGLLAAFLGTAFLGIQRGAWLILGTAYLAIGTLYLIGKARVLMVSVGPSISYLTGLRGSIGLGILFGLNIPACAAPLLLALLGASAAGAVTDFALASAFLSLAVFGFALSLPLVAAVLFVPVRRLLDRLAGLSRHMPVWTGIVFIALGLWSIRFGVLSNLPTPV